VDRTIDQLTTEGDHESAKPWRMSKTQLENLAAADATADHMSRPLGYGTETESDPAVFPSVASSHEAEMGSNRRAVPGQLADFKKLHLSDEELDSQEIARDEEYFRAELADKILEVGNRIKIAREHGGMTQQELANKIGITRESLFAIENGKRKGNIETLKKISEVLNLNFNNLIQL
jgi:DNA-binding XRE family transcriptional regulator